MSSNRVWGADTRGGDGQGPHFSAVVIPFPMERRPGAYHRQRENRLRRGAGRLGVVAGNLPNVIEVGTYCICAFLPLILATAEFGRRLLH